MRGPNMSYCMFENTESAMQQCLNAMQCAIDDNEKLDFSSHQERRAFERMAQLCELFNVVMEDYQNTFDEESA